MDSRKMELGASQMVATSSFGTLWDKKLLDECAKIPDKLAFKIGEVAALLEIKQYVLRFWETEFSILRPKKSNTGQRVYMRKDVEFVFLIRKLLHRDRFSIEGARSALKGITLKPLRAEVKEYQRSLLPPEELKTVQNKINRLSQRLMDLKSEFE